MSTEVALRAPERLDIEQIKFISSSELVPKAYRGKMADIMAAIVTGRSLGISDMHALRSIYVVDGKASISAELMVALVRNHGHSITRKVADGKCEVTGIRADNGDTITVEWTREMAETAGLLSKAVWQKYEAAMLWARAVSQLCRMLFADCLSGMVYTPEEVELTAEERVDEAVGYVPVPADTESPDDSVPAAPTANKPNVSPSEPEAVAESDASGRDGDEPADAEWEPVADSSGKGAESHAAEEGPRSPTPPAGGPDDQAPGLAAPSPEPTPHTEDTGQRSIFEQMALQAMRSKAAKDGGYERDDES